MNDSDYLPASKSARAICECCGQRIRKLNPHHLDRQKLHVLLDLWKAAQEGAAWCKMFEGEFMEFTVGAQTVRRRTAYCARSHAERLALFGFSEWHGRRTGEWRITERGRAFLQGSITAPKTVWCRDGVVLKESEERVDIRSAYRVLLDKTYWDQYPEWQRTLAELEGRA